MRFRKSGSRDFMNFTRNYRKCRRAFKRPPKWTTFFIKFHENLDFSPKTSRTTIFNNSARLISPLFCPADGAVGGFTWSHAFLSETRSAPEISLHSALEFACFLSGPRNHTTSKNSPISKNWAKTPYTCHGISLRISMEFRKIMILMKIPVP